MPLDRKQLFALHGWLGMNFGLLLALICLSGTFATLIQEIEWVAQPALRIEADGPIQWQETYEALQQAHPEMHVGGISRGEATVLDGVAWTAFLSAPDGRWKRARACTSPITCGSCTIISSGACGVGAFTSCASFRFPCCCRW
jgi:uncharacterized iron-regulated membrane protein